MTGTRRSVPNDPERRERILDAALAVIAEVGVHATTHRRIAARADVPLGSLTYYFGSLHEILELAFARFSETMSDLYRAKLTAATTRTEAEAAVVDLICGPAYADPRQMVLIFEMYAFANHNPVVAEITRTWLYRSRDSLCLHFPVSTARALDVLIEGWPVHRAFEHASTDRALVADAVHAIVGATATD